MHLNNDKPMRTILLTGGTGLIGKGLLIDLLDKGYKVIALNRSQGTIKHSNLTEIHFDPTYQSFNLIKDQLESFDVLIHLAADLSLFYSATELTTHHAVNYYYTLALLSLCAERNTHDITFIYPSSFSFLARPLSSVIDEDHPVSPKGLYPLSKYWGEQMLIQYTNLYEHINGFSLRLSSPISTSLDQLHGNVVRIWLEKALNKESITVYGDGTRKQDFISIHDISQAIQLCIQFPKENGIYNIAVGNTLSMIEMANMISEKFSVSVIKTGIDPNEGEEWNINISKAQKALNYKPQYSSREIINELIVQTLASKNP